MDMQIQPVSPTDCPLPRSCSVPPLPAAKMKTAPWLRVLGAASYSIYLFQFIFIGILWHAWLAAGPDRVMPHTASFPLLAWCWWRHPHLAMDRTSHLVRRIRSPILEYTRRTDRVPVET
jgi:hypothetical protein